jgi:hypothetical protein
MYHPALSNLGHNTRTLCSKKKGPSTFHEAACAGSLFLTGLEADCVLFLEESFRMRKASHSCTMLSRREEKYNNSGVYGHHQRKRK